MSKKPIENINNLTGILKEDYYSGAIRNNQLKEWETFWSTLHLMKDSVIVVFNESTFHNFREYKFEEFITQNVIDEIIIGEPEIKYKADILNSIKLRM